MTCKERFLQYIAVSTASDDESTESPSTVRQLELSRRLAEEMLSMGLKNVHMDRCGNAIGTLPATEGVRAGTLALIAHVDTSPDASGENVCAREVLYTGEDIELGHGVVLSEKQFPAMKDVRGKVLLVTDGSTLLGADDKAGVAEIMTALEKLIASGAPHGELRIVFTTDEEVGRGTEGLDVKELACDWGYTVDGGELGEIEYENFNAAAVTLTVEGVNIHPGSAKNKMKNAILLANQFISLLPAAEAPSHTEGYEGFYHVTDLAGNESQVVLHAIIRDHDLEKFNARKAFVQQLVDYLNARWGQGTFRLEMKDSYYNMKEKIRPHMELIENAKAAMQAVGVEPVIVPIRGGTDGARLSWERDIPCPNLCTGGANYHGVHEFVPVPSMEKTVQVLVELVKA